MAVMQALLYDFDIKEWGVGKDTQRVLNDSLAMK